MDDSYQKVCIFTKKCVLAGCGKVCIMISTAGKGLGITRSGVLSRAIRIKFNRSIACTVGTAARYVPPGQYRNGGSMTQEEKRLFLIRRLIDEQPRYRSLAIPEDAAEQKYLLRALLNVRAPAPAARDFLEIQDAYLQAAIAEKGITGLAGLQPVQEDMYLWQGDITTLRCGAIVNAANAQMLGCFCPNHGCIDNAIHTYAGVQLRLACAELMQKQRGDEETGKARITPAFNLPCDFVIHTVGPSFPARCGKGTGNCLPPATAPVWSLRSSIASIASRFAVSLRGNFIFRTTRQHKSPYAQ